MDLFTIWSFILLVFGFGFVVFFHELGHFLAAKWAHVKVEQFAVGFGQALFSWRKGIGVRFGSTAKEAETRIHDYINQKYGKTDNPSGRQVREAEEDLALGETEYRINWIPLGGYVKMLGQDDLKANAEQDDPRAYNKKSIGARMVIVSAGVVMNIILAAIGFMAIFLVGFDVPAPVVGAVVPLSPAQLTTDDQGNTQPLRVGDEILSINGTRTHDFTKIFLSAALLGSHESATLEVKHPDGSIQQLHIQPRKDRQIATQFLELGIGRESIRELRGMKRWNEQLDDDARMNEILPSDMRAIRPGDVITAVNGQAITDPDQQYPLFDQILQQSQGQPVTLEVRDSQGVQRSVQIQPQFMPPFGQEPLNFLGLVPRTRISTVSESSPALGKLLPGDVILKLTTPDQTIADPTAADLMKYLSQAGNQGQAIDMVVLRGADTVTFDGLTPNLKVAPGQYGLGIGLMYDDLHAVAASVLEDSAASRAGIGALARITAINGQPVDSWFDVRRLVLQGQKAGKLEVAWVNEEGAASQAELVPTAGEYELADSLLLTHNLQLAERQILRQASNPLQAAWWGVTETRDFIVQFYVTIRRMFSGDISPRNMMGPVGIFHAGTKITERGYDWLVWFLAMISANLAVVNFLPIPIVDGGLFTFLILEKIQGKPLSARTQSIVQFVGLALLLGIFLLVTYQDITRLFQI